MTKNDIKQYLEKIYKVDVLDVTTIIKQGLIYTRHHKYLLIVVCIAF